MLIMLASVGGRVRRIVSVSSSFRSAMIKQYLASMANPTQTVSVTTAAYGEWRPKLSAVGTFRAVNGADLALEASGVVEKILFQSGDEVAAGQILLELRKDTDNAKLQSLKATAELNAINLRRDQAQLKLHAASQATVDTDLANLKSADRRGRATGSRDRAKDVARVLRRPAGHSPVDLGQYVGAGSAW